MEALAQIPAARSLDELILGHAELHATLAAELAALTPAEFYAPQGEFWSPAQHLDHLVRSVKPLVNALGLPRIVLRLLFGKAKTSRQTGEVVAGYLKKLAGGAGAGGRYLPAAAEPETHAAQDALISRFKATGESLGKSLAGWSDADLDRYQLPHPLIGKLTVREMVAWSLYHGHHHRARIHERAKSLAG